MRSGFRALAVILGLFTSCKDWAVVGLWPPAMRGNRTYLTVSWLPITEPQLLLVITGSIPRHLSSQNKFLVTIQ